MKSRVIAQRNDLVITLRRMKSLIRSSQAKGGPVDVYVGEYDAELTKYRSMRDGGDGGTFRSSLHTIRELHFAEWRDSDFQLLIEALGEEPALDDEAWELKFGHERSIINKWFGKGGRPQ
jgi:hypothetical protein